MTYVWQSPPRRLWAIDTGLPCCRLRDHGCNSDGVAIVAFGGRISRRITNDNWKDSQQAAIQATGLAPGDDREPAILTTLIQGNWTAIVRSKNNATGVALIELYRIH